MPGTFSQGGGMLAADRHKAIVEEVNARGSVRVKELAARFGVTEDCIRKDLTQLEKRNLLKKTYGGAVRTRVHAQDFDINDRIGKHLEEKRAIARRALELVDDGDTIFLDISTSNILLAQQLASSGKRVTLVTTCLQIVAAAGTAENIHLIMLGGELNRRHDGFVGALTIEQIERYSFDTAFAGVVGVDLENDRVSTYVPAEGETKRAILKSSKRAYLMLETRKLHEDGNYWYGHVSDFTGAITERPLEGEDAERAADYAVDWLC